MSSQGGDAIAVANGSNTASVRSIPMVPVQLRPPGPNRPALDVNGITAAVRPQTPPPPGSIGLGGTGGIGAGGQATPPLLQPQTIGSSWDMWNLPAKAGSAGGSKPVEVPSAPAPGVVSCVGSAGDDTTAVAPAVQMHPSASSWSEWSLSSKRAVPAQQPVQAPCVVQVPQAPVATAGGHAWHLPSKVSAAAALRPQDGSIRRFQDVRIGGICMPLVVHVGPLFTAERSHDVEEAKRRYIRSLVLRGHETDEVESVVRNYLRHIESMESAIEQRYSPKECPVRGRQLVELVVLDGCFIIELFVQQWTRKNKGTTASATANQEPPAMRLAVPTQLAAGMVPLSIRPASNPAMATTKWEPHALRFDLIVVQNQIPFFVLEELFDITNIPEITEKGQVRRALFRKIAIDYVVGGVAGQVLGGYDGPVYHLLHLLYLHLSHESQPSSSSLQPPPPPRSRKVCNIVSKKFRLMKENLRGIRKKMCSCTSSGTPVSWQLWKVVPPVQELTRVGVRLRRKETHRIADVTFRDGTIEIPAFLWRMFNIRLLTNLVALELAEWWPPENTLFCSYAKFMSELIATKEDVALLSKEGIIQCNVDEVANNLVIPLRTLADMNHGSGYQCQFVELVDNVTKYYERLSNVGACGCFAT